MRQDIPQECLDEMARNGRAPYLVLEFKFDSGARSYSDRPLTDGLLYVDQDWRYVTTADTLPTRFFRKLGEYYIAYMQNGQSVMPVAKRLSHWTNVSSVDPLGRVYVGYDPGSGRYIAASSRPAPYIYYADRKPLDWVQVDTGIQSQCEGVAALDGVFCVASLSAPYSKYSTDLGLTWTGVDTGINGYAIAAGDGRFVIAGADVSGGRLAYSTDYGQTWTLSAYVGVFNFSAIVYSNGVWVASSDREIVYSTDGETFAQAHTFVSSDYPQLVGVAGNFYCTYTSGGAVYLLHSLGGATWNPEDSDDIAWMGYGDGELFKAEYVDATHLRVNYFVKTYDVRTPAYVKSFGELTGVEDIESVLSGRVNSRTMHVTMTRAFTQEFLNITSTDKFENTEVDIWQCFDGVVEKFLVDTLIVSEPVQLSYTEGLEFDLVSYWMRANRYMSGLSLDNDFYPVLVGSLDGIPGVHYGTFPEAELSADITTSDTTIETNVADLAAAGFTASGQIGIGFEIITYTGLSGDSFTGCTRGGGNGAATHDSGAGVYQYGINYAYAFVAGPIPVVPEVFVDGGPYLRSHTVRNDLDPVQVWFPNSPPWEVVPGAFPIESTGFIACVWGGYWYWGATDNVTVNYVDITEELLEWNPPAVVEGELVDCPHDTVYNTATVSFTDQTPSDAAFIKARFDFHVGLWSQLSSIPGKRVETWCTVEDSSFVEIYRPLSVLGDVESHKGSFIYTKIVDFLEPKVFRFLRVESDPGNTPNGAAVQGWELYGVRGVITYQKGGKTYIDDVTISIQSSASTNPADVIKGVHDRIGAGAVFEPTLFSGTWGGYDTDGYEFEGLIDGGQTVADFLQEAVVQCRAAVFQNAGVIKLIRRPLIGTGTSLRTIPASEVSYKSMRMERQRPDLITNRYLVKYDPTGFKSDYQQQYIVEDAASEAKYGVKENTDSVFSDYYLVTSQTMAEAVTDGWLAETAEPFVILTFDTYLQHADLEMYDTVTVENAMLPAGSMKGTIINSVLIPGGTENVNKLRITIAGYLS